MVTLSFSKYLYKLAGRLDDAATFVYTKVDDALFNNMSTTTLKDPSAIDKALESASFYYSKLDNWNAAEKLKAVSYFRKNPEMAQLLVALANVNNNIAQNYLAVFHPPDGFIKWDAIETQDVLLQLLTLFPYVSYALIHFVDEHGNFNADPEELAYGPTNQTIWTPCLREYGSDSKAKEWCQKNGGYLEDRWEDCGNGYSRKMCRVPVDLPAGSTKVYTPCTSNETARAAGYTNRDEMNNNWCINHVGGRPNPKDYINCGEGNFQHACFIPHIKHLKHEHKQNAYKVGVRRPVK